MSFGKRVDGPGGRRRAVRNPTSLRAQLMTPTGSVDAWMIDMSSTGAKIHGPGLPPAGQVVIVRVGSLEASGSVAWTAHELCGIAFQLPATEEERRILAKIRALFDRSEESGEDA